MTAIFGLAGTLLALSADRQACLPTGRRFGSNRRFRSIVESAVVVGAFL